MALDLTRTQKTVRAADMESDIRAQLFANNDWTVTDIVKTQEGPREKAVAVALGIRTDPSTRKPIRLPDEGISRLFRLRILSTRALKLTPEEYEARDFNDVRPGDVARFKTSQKVLDHNHRPISQMAKAEMISRGIPLDNFFEATLDADCCVMVGFELAYNALKFNGKHIVFPEFWRVKSGEMDASGKPARKMTNWLYEEVAADWHMPTKAVQPTGRR